MQNVVGFFCHYWFFTVTEWTDNILYVTTLITVNTQLAFVDVPELDELPGSQSSGQLPLLRPLRRPHHIPGASQSRLTNE